jgi:hypothetical protein
VAQRDFLALATWHSYRLRQILCDGIIKFHLAALHHVLQQQPSINACLGMNLKDGVAIDILVGAAAQFSEADRTGTMLIDKADNDSPVARVGLTAVFQIGADCVLEIFGRCFARNRQQQNQEATDAQCRRDRLHWVDARE